MYAHQCRWGDPGSAVSLATSVLPVKGERMSLSMRRKQHIFQIQSAWKECFLLSRTRNTTPNFSLSVSEGYLGCNKRDKCNVRFSACPAPTYSSQLGMADSAALWLLLSQSGLVNILWTNIKEQLWSLGATQTPKMWTLQHGTVC